MVLRVISIFLIFTFSSLAFARGSANFKKAQKSFKKGRYSQSLKYLKRGYNFKKSKSIPSSALFLIALSYQKLGKHKEAIYFFNRVVKNNYLRKHIRVMKALKKDEVDSVSIPRTLGSSYYYMGQSYYALFTQREKVSDAVRAKKYFKICDDTDFNDKCADFLENINSKIEYSKKKATSWDFFLYAGRLLFQDRLEIEPEGGGSSDRLIANNSALCYGAGIRLGNAFNGYQISGCAFTGVATIQNDLGSNNYKQSGVPIGGLLAEAGYYWLMDNESARLGLSLPVMYRSGVYSEPDGYTIPDAKAFNFGAMFSAGLKIPLVELEVKMGHMSYANILMLNGVYTF